MTERDFKGVWIPKEIYLDERLNALDKIIFTEVDSLDMGERGCFASNKHLADFCQCSERKVSETISKLIKIGYIYIKSFDGRTRELKSRLAINAKQGSKICEAETQNLLHSNTYNNTDNKTYSYCEETPKPKSKRKSKQFTPPTLEEVKTYCKERNSSVDAKKFFDYFNAGDWTDAKGNPVLNWKQKLITWESNSSNGFKKQEQPTLPSIMKKRDF